MASVSHNTFYLTVALIGQKILSFVFFTLLARFLGVAAIGTYTFALAFTTIFSIITDLGLTPVLIREVARAKERASEYVRTILSIKLFLTVVAYCAALGAAYFLGHPPLTLQLISVAGIVMALDALHLTFYGALRGLQVLKYEALGMVAGQGITLIFGALALALHLPLYSFLWALALGSAWNVGFSYAQCRRYGIVVMPRWNRAVARATCAVALPFALSGIFVRVYSYIDTVLLQHMKGDLVVGWYSVPYKITYAFQFLPMALSAAVYPALSFAWRNNKEQMKWIFERAVRYSILLALPIAFGISALAPEIILTIYGQEFANSILPLKISIFGLIFIFLYFPVGALLNAMDRQSTNTFFMGITMVANIILNLFLIPRYGAVGASIAAVATNAFLWLGTLLVSMRIIRPSALIMRTGVSAFAASYIMAIAVLQLKQFIFWPFTIAVGGIIYIGFLLATRAIGREDLRAFTKLFRTQPSAPEQTL